MKRMVFLLLASVICLSACGKTGQEDTPQNTTTAPAVVDVALEGQYLTAISHLKQYLAEEQVLLLDEQTLQGTLYKGNDALLYLRATFAELGDYKQAKEIAGRFSQDDSFVGTCEGKAVDADGQETPVQGYTVWTDAQGRLLAAHNIRYTYDENGHLTEEQTLEDGQVCSRVQYTYNQSGQLVSEKSSLQDGSSYEITYTYNEFGKVLTKTENGEDTTYSYTYDDQGHLLSASSVSASSGEYAYTYDASGNLASQKRLGDKVEELHRTYDESGRVVEENILTGEETLQKTYVYEGALLIKQTETFLKKDKPIKQVTWNFTYKPKVDFNREGLTLSE